MIDDLELEVETTEDLLEFPKESSEEETAEDLLEFLQESTQEENMVEESIYEESTVEISGEVQVVNFDAWNTPLNSCSVVTLSVLLILFFVAIATIGGVLNE